MGTNNCEKPKIHFDKIFVNPDFSALAEAIDCQKNHKKTMIILEGKPESGDDWIITHTFPVRLRETHQLLKKQKAWQSIFSLVPHLVQKQKVIYLNKNSGFQLNGLIADKLYNHSFNEKRKQVNKKIIAALPLLPDSKLKGIIFLEYQVNISRFYMELLKYYHSKKGKVKFGQISFMGNSCSLNSNQFQAEEIIKSSKQVTSGIEIPHKVKNEFEVVIKDSNILLHLSGQKNKIQAWQIATKNLLKKKELIQLASHYFTFNTAAVTDFTTIDSPSTATLLQVFHTVNDGLPCSFENTSVDDQHEICLEKFDLAKQTGITYHNLKKLFHRYGTGVDELIERAYQLLNKTRDTDEIWAKAELEYQQKYEWHDTITAE